MAGMSVRACVCARSGESTRRRGVGSRATPEAHEGRGQCLMLPMTKGTQQLPAQQAALGRPALPRQQDLVSSSVTQHNQESCTGTGFTGRQEGQPMSSVGSLGQSASQRATRPRENNDGCQGLVRAVVTVEGRRVNQGHSPHIQPENLGEEIGRCDLL